MHINVVIIRADLNWVLALGCAGATPAKTPNVDALARRGAVFTHAWTAGLICAPSRASMHTGLHVQAHGVYTNGISVRPGVTTTAEILTRHGYQMHNMPLQARSDGMQYAEWLASKGYTNVVTPVIGSRDKARLIPTPYRFETGRAGLDAEHSHDAWTIANAVAFLGSRNRSQPFAMFVPLHASHDPYVVPGPWDVMYRPGDLALPAYRAGEFDHKPARQKRTWQATGADRLTDEQIRTILGHYLGMVSYTDMLVGRLFKRLSALGLDDNTVIIYTADHGDCMGQHRIFTKGFGAYEPAMRIPFVIRAPGHFTAEKRRTDPISGVDFLPTMLECMNLPAESGLHGRSAVNLTREIRPVFAGQNQEGRDRIVMIRTEQWKLTRYDEGGGELYDCTADPNELDNRIDDPKFSGIKRELTAQLEQWDRTHRPAV
jgi:choline-sulfatase